MLTPGVAGYLSRRAGRFRSLRAAPL